MQTHSTPKTKSLRELLSFAGLDVPDVQITDITLDSRAVTPGAAFIALPGLRDHGITFASQAIAQGARVILYEPVDGIQTEASSNVPIFAITSLSRLVGTIADRFFDSPSKSLQVVGVTGTNGKTTSAYLISAALMKLKKAAGYSGTLGYGHIEALEESQHTTSDCITVHRQLASMRDAGDKYVGMEVSSHALDQNRIGGVRVHSALFTNLTRDHLDYHGTLENYGAAKEKLFHQTGLQHSAINAADTFGRELIVRLTKDPGRAPITAYGATRNISQFGDRQLIATRVDVTSVGTRIDFDGAWGAGRLNARLIGAFNVENILGVLAVLLGLDIPLLEATQALEQCGPPPGRMETLSAPNRPLVVVDYAHTPDALGKALQTARVHTKGRVLCVFGCGGDRDAGKRPLMGEIAEQLADVIVLTDDNPRMENADAIIADILQGLSEPTAAIVERDRAKAIARSIGMATPQDLVLIAGKGHESYQIIGRNVRNFSDREEARKCLGLTR